MYIVWIKGLNGSSKGGSKGPYLVDFWWIILEAFHKNILLQFLHSYWPIYPQIESMYSQKFSTLFFRGGPS